MISLVVNACGTMTSLQTASLSYQGFGLPSGAMTGPPRQGHVLVARAGPAASRFTNSAAAFTPRGRPSRGRRGAGAPFGRRSALRPGNSAWIKEGQARQVGHARTGTCAICCAAASRSRRSSAAVVPQRSGRGLNGAGDQAGDRLTGHGRGTARTCTDLTAQGDRPDPRQPAAGGFFRRNSRTSWRPSSQSAPRQTAWAQAHGPTRTMPRAQIVFGRDRRWAHPGSGKASPSCSMRDRQTAGDTRRSPPHQRRPSPLRAVAEGPRCVPGFERDRPCGGAPVKSGCALPRPEPLRSPHHGKLLSRNRSAAGG